MNRFKSTGGRSARMLIAAALALSQPAPAQTAAAAKPVLTWTVLDLPPGSMPVAGKLSDGITDVVLKLLFEELRDWEHRVLVVNAARAIAMLAEGAPACFGTAIHTIERERMAYFSLTHVIPPLRLVARADVVERLPRNELGEVLPANLFDRQDLRGLVVPLRSYSPVLDALLKLRGTGSNIRTVLSTEGGANILKMLRLGRADYTVEYDFVLALLQTRNPELAKGAQLKSLPLAGTEPFHVGIACPHTEWGRKAILEIDAALSLLATRPEYRNSLNRWLPPEGIKRYQKAQAEFFRQRAQAADPGKYPLLPNTP